jgi:hypothetical protein
MKLKSTLTAGMFAIAAALVHPVNELPVAWHGA